MRGALTGGPQHKSLRPKGPRDGVRRRGNYGTILQYILLYAISSCIILSCVLYNMILYYIVLWYAIVQQQ